MNYQAEVLSREFIAAVPKMSAKQLSIEINNIREGMIAGKIPSESHKVALNTLLAMEGEMMKRAGVTNLDNEDAEFKAPEGYEIPDPEKVLRDTNPLAYMGIDARKKDLQETREKADLWRSGVVAPDPRSGKTTGPGLDGNSDKENPPGGGRTIKSFG